MSRARSRAPRARSPRLRASPLPRAADAYEAFQGTHAPGRVKLAAGAGGRFNFREVERVPTSYLTSCCLTSNFRARWQNSAPRGRTPHTMPRATATARARDGVSLLDAPDGWFSSASLRELKLAASRAGLERAWQDVRAAHRPDLAEALLRVRDEWAAFVATVRASTVEDAIRKGVREIRDHLPTRPAGSRRAPRPKPEALRDALERAASDTLRASVHVVPSGSGVHLGEGLILTCAHCVAADDDESESESESEHEAARANGRDRRDKRRRERRTRDAAEVVDLTDDFRDVVDLTASPDATPPPSFAPSASFRVGRVREVITARGDVRGAECVAADETRDLALLRLLDPPRAYSDADATGPTAPIPTPTVPAGLTAVRVAPPGGDGVGVAVVAVGNPHDRDLEAPEGSAPREMGYTPFWVSVGEVLDVAAEAPSAGLGRLKHGCWTYWGHSGCPIVDERGELVGVHNSWDDRDAARHGACLEDVRRFLRACGVDEGKRARDEVMR